MPEREVQRMTCENCGKEIPPECLSAEYEPPDDDHIKVTACCTECHAAHVGYLHGTDLLLDRSGRSR